ncbi:unnamed protein product [Camellia sinensis]
MNPFVISESLSALNLISPFESIFTSNHTWVVQPMTRSDSNRSDHQPHGRYEVGKLLGHGTFATVYHARNIQTGESVAIKVIDKEKILKGGLIAHIKREISILRRVRHPNVVQLFEVMATKSKIYFVMEYVRGKLPGQRAQGIQLCPKVNKTERELLKQEELDAQQMFLGNAKARKFPRYMVTAINNAPKGYKSPNYEKVRTNLLDKEQSKVQQSLNPLMQDWSIHGVSIVFDGWSNLKNQTLINIMAVSGGKAIFISGHDVSSKEKNATNIADLLIKAIEFVGPSNVVQVVTNNATNCKAAGAIIQRKYSHIFWSGCLAHTLNLLMKDIAKCEDPALLFVDESYKRGKEVVKYIKNHSSCQYLFKTFSGLDLLKAKKTRFGHHFIVLQRLVKVKPALLSMALSKQWENLRKNTSSPHQHDIVHQTIMDDDFWRKAKTVLTITKHIYKMLRFSDSDKAVIGEVYELMDTMLGNIKDTLSNDPIVYDLIHQFVVERWNKMNIHLHCLAYILVPKYYTNSWLSKSAPGGVRRKKPHFDVEVQKGYLEAIEKIICDQTEAVVIRKQISDFVSCKGVFSQPQAVNDRATMDALSWWHLYGGAAPELYSLALKVLSQSVNTSCAERCWSTYSYIHNVKRNRLNVDRAEKLVFVHYNHRLLSRYREDYENFKNWDAHPEDANIEEDIMAIEERDNVSLSDSEDDTTLAASVVQPCPTPTPLPTSSSSPLPTSQEHSMEQVAAQRRLEKACGKRQKK